MREAYEEFRALRASEAEAEILDLKSFKGKQSHDLKDFDPGLKLKLPSQPEPVWQNDARNELPPLDVAPQNSQPIAQSPVDQIPLLGGDSGGAIGVTFNYTFSYTFNLPLPSAVATVTFQKATLYDNDIFGDLSTFGFQSIAQLMPVLEALTNFASSLSLISIDKMSLAADWFSIAAEISDAAAGLDLISNDNVSVAVFQGEAAQSTFVNGIEVESFPEWETILPVYHAEKLALAKELASAEAHARDFEDNAESPLKVEAGHEVVAGANSLINTASITSSWLDAPVFAVAGNVLRFDAISQVNILIEHDFAFSGSLAQDASEAASKTINAATIATRTVEEAKLAASVKKGEAVAPTSTSDPVSAQTTPSNWTVVRHEGDVVQYNWVKQYTFSTDMDQAVLTFSGASTFLGLGENTIANSFTTQQFGFGYDLIIVGGNMIDVNLVSQKNAVLDSDSLSIGRQKPDPVTPEDEMEEVFVLGTSVDGISQAALKPVNLEPEEPSADELAFLDTTSVVAREAASQPFASDDQLPAKSDAEAVGSPGTADVRTIATELEVPREI